MNLVVNQKKQNPFQFLDMILNFNEFQKQLKSENLDYLLTEKEF